MNTVDLEPGEEQLTDPAALGAWLTDSGLAPDLDPPSESDLRHAVELREALRAILADPQRAVGGGSPPPDGRGRDPRSNRSPRAPGAALRRAGSRPVGARQRWRGRRAGKAAGDRGSSDRARHAGSGSRPVASIRARGRSMTTQRTGRARGATWPTAAIGPRQRPTGKGDQALTSVRRCRPSAATTDWSRTARSARGAVGRDAALSPPARRGRASRARRPVNVARPSGPVDGKRAAAGPSGPPAGPGRR